MKQFSRLGMVLLLLMVFGSEVDAGRRSICRIRCRPACGRIQRCRARCFTACCAPPRCCLSVCCPPHCCVLTYGCYGYGCCGPIWVIPVQPSDDDKAEDEDEAEDGSAVDNSYSRYGQFVSLEGPLDSSDITTLAEQALQKTLIGSVDSHGVFAAYFEALVVRQAGLTELAEEKLQAAIALERQHPVANWGRSLERLQGRDRNWIEDARYSSR